MQYTNIVKENRLKLDSVILFLQEQLKCIHDINTLLFE